MQTHLSSFENRLMNSNQYHYDVLVIGAGHAGTQR